MTVPANPAVTAEVGPGSGLDVGIEPGRGRQIPSDLPNKGQVRKEREQERKQSQMEQYFKKVKLSEDNTRTATEVDSGPAIRPSTIEQAQLRNVSSYSRKRKVSGELPPAKNQILVLKDQHKAGKNWVAEMEDTGLDSQSLEEQGQIAGEDQVGDRPRAVAVNLQFPSISDISEKERVEIARKKAEALKRLQGKNPRDETKLIECVKKKRKKGQEKKRTTAPVKPEKRKVGEVEKTEAGNEGKRGKSDGQDGCKQLGCSTHKGIS